MNGLAILQTVATAAITGLIFAVAGYFWHRHFTSLPATRLRIYRRTLAEMLQVKCWNRDWRKMHASISVWRKMHASISVVKGDLKDPQVPVLEKWLRLREALPERRLQLSEITGRKFFKSIKLKMLESSILKEEAKIIGDQIDEAKRDPRFGETAAARRWMEEMEAFAARDPAYQAYYEAVTGNLPLLDEACRNSDWDTAEFRVAAASVSLTRGRASTVTAKVVIPENPFVAWTREQRRHLERCPESNNRWPAKDEMEKFRMGSADKMPVALMRFSAGGSLTILKVLKEDALQGEGNVPKTYNENDYTEYIVVGQKDGQAGIHPYYLVPSSGISEQEDDWIMPRRIVVGECVEEIRLRARADDSWFFPYFEGEDAADLNSRVDATVESHRRNIETYEADRIWNSEIPNRPRECHGSLKRCRAEILSIGDDSLIITHGRREQKYQELLVLDAEFGAIDVMAAVRIEVPKLLSQLRVLDGEVVRDKDRTKMKLLWRNVFVFLPEEFSKVFSGEESRAAAYFGREENGNWRDGEPVGLSARPLINPPLLRAGPAVLRRLYHIDVNPFTQSAERPRVTF
jgi:hypothetical protein